VKREWEFFIERTDHGKVTVQADTEKEARAMARDYARRIIQVDGKSWESVRYIREDLVEVRGGN
jgi:hypothetical protein